jgi:hypothetical protein
MATKRQTTKLAEKLGVSLELTIDSQTYDADCWSPSGKIFNSSGCHCFVVNHNAGFGLSTFYDEVLEELNAGLTDCTHDECEHCEE